MTPRQHDCLTFIRSYQEERGGVSPSFGEMRKALGLASNSGVDRILKGLERAGLIRRDKHLHRAIVLTDQAPDLSKVSTDDLLAELHSRHPWVSAA